MVPSIPESPPPLVFVIDDDLATQTAVLAALSTGFEVAIRPGASLHDAPTLGPPPDLVVTPDASALDVRMQPGWQDVPLLLVTDGPAAEVHAALWRWAAQDYVTRPLGGAELRARAANLVAVRRASLLLRHDLACDGGDIELLALASALRRQELAEALAAAEAARDRSERAGRTLTAYVRTVGHELASPLAALRDGLAQLRPVAEPGHAKVLTALDGAVAWIAELSRELIDRSRSEPPPG